METTQDDLIVNLTDEEWEALEVECSLCGASYTGYGHKCQRRNIVIRQQTGCGWVPRDAWYVTDVDTGECFAWHWSRTEAAALIPVYESW